MKQVQDLIIGTSYDTTLTLANFATKAVGAVNIIDPETGASWVSGGNSIIIARVCADSDGRLFVRQSLPVGSNLIRSHVSKTYTASTAKQMTVTIPAITPSAGDVFELFITDYNDYNYIVGRRRIAYEAVSGDAETEVAAGLAAQINSDDSIPNVSATSAAGVITIVGEPVSGSGNVINNFRADYEVLFNIALAEGLSGIASLDTPVNASKGCGTYREIRKIEEVYKGYKGYLNRVIYPTSVNIQYDSAVGSTYDTDTIQHKQYQHTNNEGNVNPEVSTIIAGVVGAMGAFKADLATALEELK